jgi:hypothetical protein
MKKVLFDLNHKEKSRILEMHQLATRKQYLMENVSNDDKLMAIEIASLLNKVTGRNDINFQLLPEDVKKMFVILGDLETDISIKLIPNYDIPRVQDAGWGTLSNVVNNTSKISSNEVIDSINKFLEELVNKIKEYFPNDDLSEVKELLNNFNIQLDNYKN